MTENNPSGASVPLSQAIGQSSFAPNGMLNTAASISALIDTLSNLPTSPPPLYLDIEGINLSRHGSISIIQLLVLPRSQIYLIDVHVLGRLVFSTPGCTGQTLKGILESSSIPKVFFDVRNDSDALFSHFNINLAGIVDLQLMEFATRNFFRKHLNGLAKCIEYDLGLTATEKQKVKQTKEAGRKLFAPELGGNYEMFNVRPLPDALTLYCLQDVQYMPRLWEVYNGRLHGHWVGKVEQGAKDRVVLSQSPSYNGKGPDRALPPTGWK